MFEKYILPGNHPEVIRRQRICAQCEYLMVVPALSRLTGFHCRICKCILAAKTRVANQHCPIERW